MLTLNGKSFSLRQISSSAIKVKTFLDKTSKGSIFTGDVLSEKCGVSLEALRHDVKREKSLAEYSLFHGRFRYWGRPSAIAMLRKRIEEGE